LNTAESAESHHPCSVAWCLTHSVMRLLVSRAGHCACGCVLAVAPAGSRIGLVRTMVRQQGQVKRSIARPKAHIQAISSGSCAEDPACSWAEWWRRLRITCAQKGAVAGQGGYVMVSKRQAEWAVVAASAAVAAQGYQPLAEGARSWRGTAEAARACTGEVGQSNKPLC